MSQSEQETPRALPPTTEQPSQPNQPIPLTTHPTQPTQGAIVPNPIANQIARPQPPPAAERADPSPQVAEDTPQPSEPPSQVAEATPQPSEPPTQ
eukprot:2431465-Pyramimonas_sp.AAC.1